MNKPELPKELIPKIKDGQQIKVIGLGGVGEKVARALAMFVAASNVKATLTLIDGDNFEPSNINRQMFDDFGNKGHVIANSLLPKFVESNMNVDVVEQYVTPANIASLIQEGDIVLLCLDNHKSRKLISDWARTLKDVVIISGGNDGVEPAKDMRGTFSNVQIYIRKDGEDISSPLTSFHPEIENPTDKMPHEKSCTDLMQSTPQLLFANMQTAMMIVNALYLYWCGCLHYSELQGDLAEGWMRPVMEM